MKKNIPPWCKAVKIEMIKKDWSIQDLADACNLSREYVCAVINGRVYSASAVKAVSTVLGIAETSNYVKV